MKKRWMVWLTVIMLGFSGTVFAAAESRPIDELKEPIQRGIDILKAPEYKGDREVQREKIWELIQKVFDFRAVTIMALARNWRDLSPDQQKSFTEEFTELLKNTYLDKIQGEFSNEEIVFDQQDMLSEDKAVVRTKVIRGKIETPIDYRVHLKNGKWLVYDVNIEGVSLVQNYRKQFNDILAKETPEQLIQRLEEKNQSHAKDRQKKE